MKNTEEMIDMLARAARPVERSEQPLVSLSKWIAISAVYLAFGIMLIGARSDLAQVWHRFEFLIHTLLVSGVTVLTATAAFALSIPNRRQRWVVWIPSIALTAWSAWIIAALVTANELHAGSGWKCLKNIIVLSVPLGMLMYRMMSTAAPLRRSTAGCLAALSAAAAGDLATRLICRNDHALHALVWHFVPVLVLGCTGVALGRILPWCPSTRESPQIRSS
jgi:hypothetical protein